MRTLEIDTASNTHIQPIMMKDCEHTNRMAAALRDKGILVSSIRYPTVPKDSPRIRLSLTAMHSHEDIDTLAKALSEVRDV
jgi:8-amino-7-oxononanoate synthase